MSHRILIIDDDDTLYLLSDYLERRLRYEVATAKTGAEGLALALTGPFDLCVVDIGLPETAGGKVYMRLQS